MNEFKNLIVDEDGVPVMIQNIEYYWNRMQFDIRLFNGLVMTFCTETVCPSMTLMQFAPNKKQWRIAHINIEKQLELDWEELQIAFNDRMKNLGWI